MTTTDWEARWQRNDTAWDRGESSPALQRWLDARRISERVLVPGAGSGYEVVDLGVDVAAEKFLEEAEKYPDAVIGLSALLTTTMVNMEKIVKTVKDKMPDRTICIGGAPITQDFCNKINADLYSPDPQGVVEYLDKISA